MGARIKPEEIHVNFRLNSRVHFDILIDFLFIRFVMY